MNLSFKDGSHVHGFFIRFNFILSFFANHQQTSKKKKQYQSLWLLRNLAGIPRMILTIDLTSSSLGEVEYSLCKKKRVFQSLTKQITNAKTILGKQVAYFVDHLVLVKTAKLLQH